MIPWLGTWPAAANASRFYAGLVTSTEDAIEESSCMKSSFNMAA